MLDTTLDPTITQDMADEARTATPIDYDQVFAEIAARLSQDTPDPLTLVAPTVRKPGAACVEARRWHDDNITVGVGMCLGTVRRYFNVDALWPDAETAGEHSAPLHRSANPADFPRGSVGYAYNGRHGHVWLNVGGGLCWTTDYRRAGLVDLAPVAAMAPWIGGRLIGWGEVLEDVDVWPFDVHGNPIPKPRPKLWTWEERLAQIERDLARAKKHHSPQRKIDSLEAWAGRIKANHQ